MGEDEVTLYCQLNTLEYQYQTSYGLTRFRLA